MDRITARVGQPDPAVGPEADEQSDGPLVRTLADLVFPARDERFGTLSERLSEATKAPSGDNFVSNEDSYPRVVTEVERRALAGEVYLGVGPDQNFTLMAAAKPSLAFIADYRPRNRLLHLLHKALFCLSADRVSYLARLTARSPGPTPADSSSGDLVAAFEGLPFDQTRHERTVAEVKALLETLGLITKEGWGELATIQSRLAGPGLNARFLALRMYPTVASLMTTRDRAGLGGHFLADERRYQDVRRLQRTDRVIPMVADFAGPDALRLLGDWLSHRGLRIGTFYVSDVEFFVLRAGRFGAYVANLDRLPWSEGAVIVRTSTREIEHPARVAGDSSTTVVVSALAFMEKARAGRIKGPDDLFESVP